MKLEKNQNLEFIGTRDLMLCEIESFLYMLEESYPIISGDDVLSLLFDCIHTRLEEIEPAPTSEHPIVEFTTAFFADINSK